MSELNREQVKKALEWAISEEFCENCLCTVYGKSMTSFLNETFALINSQEQRIGELAEENNGLQELVRVAVDTQNSMGERIEKLTEENEYLKQQNEIYAVLNEKMEHICESYAFQYGTAVPKEVFLKKERERTIREMQEMLKAESFIVAPETNLGAVVLASDIDRVAEKMLEDTE